MVRTKLPPHSIASLIDTAAWLLCSQARLHDRALARRVGSAEFMAAYTAAIEASSRSRSAKSEPGWHFAATVGMISPRPRSPISPPQRSAPGAVSWRDSARSTATSASPRSSASMCRL